MGRTGDIRDKLIGIGAAFIKERFVISKAGNISARSGRYMYIKAKGSALDSCRKKDYVRVAIRTGACPDGTPSSEKYMHLACYNKRPDIKAVLHLHPVFSTAVANSRIKLGPVSYELLACLGSPLVRAHYMAAGSKALAKEISSIIGKANAVLLPNHGLLVVAGDLDTAFYRALAVERACQVLVYSKLLGLSRFLPAREARRIISLYKNLSHFVFAF